MTQERHGFAEGNVRDGYGGDDRGVRPSEGRPRDTQKQGLSRPKDPKRGTNGGGTAEKKSESLENMGQSGAGRRTERRTESCRCAGWQTKKYRRPDRPKRVETFKSAGVCGTACIGRAKQEKFWEMRQATHTQDGQDRELCPNLHLIPEALHLSNLPTPSQPKTKKRMRETKGRKSVFFRI